MARKTRRETPLLVGSLALALLAAVCGVHHGGRIARDLEKSASRELAAAGIAGAEVVADGRDLALRGAPLTADLGRAVALLEALPGVRRVVDETAPRRPPPPAEPPSAAPPERDAACRRLADLAAEPGIDFGSRSAEPTAASGPRLDRLAAAALACPEARIRVSGHTDSRGGSDFNLILSRQRAEAVAAALTARGVPAERLEALGYGESAPVADNATAAGRARNRRIEIDIR